MKNATILAKHVQVNHFPTVYLANLNYLFSRTQPVYVSQINIGMETHAFFVTQLLIKKLAEDHVNAKKVITTIQESALNVTQNAKLALEVLLTIVIHALPIQLW